MLGYDIYSTFILFDFYIRFLYLRFKQLLLQCNAHIINNNYLISIYPLS